MYTPAIAALALPTALLLLAGTAAAESTTDCPSGPCEGNYNLNINEGGADVRERPSVIVIKPRWRRPAPMTAVPPTGIVPIPPPVIEPPEI